MKISFQIVPQTTPSAFVRYLLDLWPRHNDGMNKYNNSYNMNNNNNNHTRSSDRDRHVPQIPYMEILAIADNLMGLFWEGMHRTYLRTHVLIYIHTYIHIHIRTYMHALSSVHLHIAHLHFLFMVFTFLFLSVIISMSHTRLISLFLLFISSTFLHIFIHLCFLPIALIIVFLTLSIYFLSSISDPDCMRYAPSTIAISALLLTFSKLHLDCTEWLHRLPDECLPPKICDNIITPHSIFPLEDIAYLDIDNCLLCLQKIPMISKHINQSNRGLSINVNAANQNLNNNMDCQNEIISPKDSDSDGQSSVRTITPTSTAELCEERNNELRNQKKVI